jgi:steroid 5-alpha reductase family enzyme
VENITLLAFLLLISLGINLFMFIPAFIYRTDKLTDLSYSISFIFLILFGLFWYSPTPQNIILSFMVILWALRLGVFLFIRIRKMEKDKRFDGIRESFLRFIKFWILQGFAVWIILVPSLFFIVGIGTDFFWFGFFVWLIGLLIESTADFQKYRFNQISSNKGLFINKGLWKYSRHPNYFGEILCWIGVYVFVFPSLNGLERFIALVSPLTIIILLIFITGLPPLEKYADKKWGELAQYKEYKRRTQILVPWFRKK